MPARGSRVGNRGGGSSGISGRKRKQGDGRVLSNGTTHSTNKKSRASERVVEEEEEEEPWSSSEEDPVEEEKGAEDALDEAETADEKRMRLAKQYLKQLRREELEEEDDDEEEDEDEEREEEEEVEEEEGFALRRVEERLAAEGLEAKGRRKRILAQHLQEGEGEEQRVQFTTTLTRGHSLSPTSVALTRDETTAYTGSKDATIIKYDVETGKKLWRFLSNNPTERKKNVEGHVGHVLAVAVSSDGKLLASGGRDKFVRVWDTRTNSLVSTFKGHRDAVSALAFQHNSHQLFSGSHDRTVKIWDLEEMAYVESLYGHQSEITAVDSFIKERAISSGRDVSVRLWKVAEESQLIFKGQHLSIDSVALIDEEHFVSGSQDGSLAYWSSQKKKPIFVMNNAHKGNWICSVACCKNTDLLASGSSDGFIRLWNIDNQSKLQRLPTIPTLGFVNGLSFGSSGRVLVAAVGQEHRLGRWESIKPARNSLVVVRLAIPV